MMQTSLTDRGVAAPRFRGGHRRWRRPCLAAIAAVATTTASMSSWLSIRGVRCFANEAVARIPWPDARLWLGRSPAGVATLSKQRSPGAAIAFDTYSQHLPGTREVQIGENRFYAFSSPRLGAEHMIVWRRLEDVKALAAAFLSGPAGGTLAAFEPDPSIPVRITSCDERPQLTSAVWSWDKLDVRDPMRYWDDGEGGDWMYWESFWVPVEPAAYATTSPAFGDPAGSMLAPLFRPDGAAHPSSPSDLDSGISHAEVMPEPMEPEQVVPSTATATAQKDRAYAIVYQYNVWGSDVSRSGTGSDLWSPEARLAITALEVVIENFGVRSMLDCACGDATWIIPFFVARHPEISYCGVDIVPEVIEMNKQKYPGVQFLALDLAEKPLPTGVDMVFSKETMNHMPIEDAQQTIDRFRATGARYLLTSVHEGSDNALGYNKGCYTTYIKYDYELPPFSLKKLARIIEYQGLNTSYTLYAL